MPDLTLVYAPDPGLGVDPLDGAQTPRRLGEVIPLGTDMLVVWRVWGEQYQDGSRTHVVGDGAWSHLTHDQIMDALSAIEGFG